MSVQMLSWPPQATFTTKVTPRFGSNGGPCGVTLSTVTSAAPMNRCSVLSGSCWLPAAYSLACTETTESALSAGQFRLTTLRPGFMRQKIRIATGASWGVQSSG